MPARKRERLHKAGAAPRLPPGIPVDAVRGNAYIPS